MRLKFGAFLLSLLVVAAAPAAFAASPLTFVREIPLPLDEGGYPAPIGIVSFPAGSVGGVPYPAQRFLISTWAVYLLPARGSNAAVTPLWWFTGPRMLFLTPASSLAEGWVRPDGTREIDITTKPRNLVRFNLENGTVISNEPVFTVLPGAGSFRVNTPGNGFFLTSGDRIVSVDLDDPEEQDVFPIPTGSGDGQLSEPSALSLGPDGLLYVLDVGNRRIEGFTLSGGYVRQFPLAPNDPLPPEYGTRQFAVAPDGRFYVGDGDGAGSAYDASGNFLGTFSGPADVGRDPASAAILSVDPDGTVLAIESTGRFIDEFVPSAPTIAEVISEVQASDLGAGNSTSLVAKLQSAQASLDAGNNTAARNQLQAFIHEVAALQASVSLTPATAARLTADAQAIINIIPA